VIAVAVCLSFLPAVAGTAGPGDEPPAELLPFVPKGYQVLDFAVGDLDRDGRADAVLVLKKPDENEPKDGEDVPRPLLLLVRQADGRLKQARRNDRLVYCATCGGMMGDPYQGIEVAPGRFTVTHYGGSAWRWSAVYSFAYDAAKKDWFLDREESGSFHASDPAEGTNLTITRTELGDVPIGSFDSDRDEPKKTWRVVAERARFYDQPDRKSAPRKAYVVKGDLVESDRELTNFVRATFTNRHGESTYGFLLKTDLETLASPRPR
jgi:hypothetical protein